MPTLGEQLRTAREARGASASEAAVATRMKVQHVEALEANDYTRVAAPTYAKGFIRLYAEYLGLDPAPLIRLYEQNYMPRTRAPILAPEAEASSAPMPSEPAAASAPGVPLSERVRPVAEWLAGQAQRLRPHAPWVVGGIAILVAGTLTLRACSRSEPPVPVAGSRPVPAGPGALIEEAPAPYLDVYLR